MTQAISEEVAFTTSHLVYLHGFRSSLRSCCDVFKLFEALKGDRRGQHSIRINAQWRICFVWREDGAHEVEIVDYH